MLAFFDWKAKQPDLSAIDYNPRLRQEFNAIIESPDVARLRPSAEQSLLYDIKDGVIGATDEKWLLSGITAPFHKPGGTADVVKDLTDKHEKRFLANFTSVGFDNFNRISADSVQEFVSRYPTPVDFERAADTLIAQVRNGSGAAKGREYETAKTSFMKKVYGKLYEYHLDFKKLQEEANKLPDKPENSGEKLSKHTGYACIDKTTLANVNAAFSRSDHNNPKVLTKLRDKIVANRKKSFEAGDDTVLVDEKQQLFGIFDGAGGIDGGKAASNLARRLVRSFAEKFRLQNGAHLASALTNSSSGLVRANRNGRKVGITTGVLAKITNDPRGGKTLAYANAGDSRLYVVHANGDTRQLTKDEGVGKKIENYLGPSSAREFDDSGVLRRDNYSGRANNVTQYGEYHLTRDDKIVLCSDGITGDTGSDLMSPEEVGYYVSRSSTAQAAAENLLGYARKSDDRSIIVVDAYPEPSVVDNFLKRFQ